MQPRYVKPEQLRIGDTIRVSAKLGDMTIETVGVYANKRITQQLVEYETASGRTLFNQYQRQVPTIELLLDDAGVQHITLLDRLPELEDTLWDATHPLETQS